jgi:hypothetical protein
MSLNSHSTSATGLIVLIHHYAVSSSPSLLRYTFLVFNNFSKPHIIMDKHHLTKYFHYLKSLLKGEILQERLQHFQSINADVFNPLPLWPVQYKRLYWSKSMSDKYTFRFCLFLIGNGCEPKLNLATFRLGSL